MLSEGYQKYFLAIIPPEPLYGEIQAMKQRIGVTYHTRGALRSPAHITMHMPFLWNESKEEKLTTALKRFASDQKPFELALNGFSCFRPRVVFVAVETNPLLNDLQYRLVRFCRMQLNLLNANYKDKPFHPHITLAFRDLKKEHFDKLWSTMENESFSSTFQTSAITLLKHDGQQWLQHKHFSLINF